MANQIARADVVGSLLRPPYLLAAKQDLREGKSIEEELSALEDRAVIEAIKLQESCGIQCITDGEYRRNSWIPLVPIIDDPIHEPAVSGIEFLPVDAGWIGLWKEPTGERISRESVMEDFHMTKEAFVTGKLKLNYDIVNGEYPFLKLHAHGRIKFNVPAPSWHRIYWHKDYSTDAYKTSDDFIKAMAEFMREHIIEPLLSMDCDYIQIDAPNYAQWHIDPECREQFEQFGHDMEHELIADAEFDNMLFEGVSGITTAIHMCRGNAPRGRYLASGGYEAISKKIFPRWTNINTLLLEYDSDRAGDFKPLADTLDHHIVVLGLVSTKTKELEDKEVIIQRIKEAAEYVPLERLAISPQCGFSSGEWADTMGLELQERKLKLVGDIAKEVWT